VHGLGFIALPRFSGSAVRDSHRRAHCLES
jgi:hypothetical protein